MRYDPKAAKPPGGAPGTYWFTVSKAVEGPSRAGNTMITLTLTVNESIVFDYLVNTPGGLWKAKMFCKEVGLDFDLGCLTIENVIGKTGRCVLDYDKRDLAKVLNGELDRAYLKVMRYGVHGEPPANVPQKKQPDAPAVDPDEPPSSMEDAPF